MEEFDQIKIAAIEYIASQDVEVLRPVLKSILGQIGMKDLNRIASLAMAEIATRQQANNEFRKERGL